MTEYIRETFADFLFVVRYITLGILSTFIQFGSFWLLYEVAELWYLAAAAAAFMVRYAVKFLLVRQWLFGTTVPGSIPNQAIRFTLLEAVYLGAGLALMAALVEIARMPPFWALVISSFVTSMSALVITRYVFDPGGKRKGPGMAAGGPLKP